VVDFSEESERADTETFTVRDGEEMALWHFSEESERADTETRATRRSPPRRGRNFSEESERADTETGDYSPPRYLTRPISARNPKERILKPTDLQDGAGANR